MKLYERVAQIAAKRGLSISKVEKMAGIGNGTIGKWRTNRNTKINTLEKVAKALDVSVEYLLGSTDEQ